MEALCPGCAKDSEHYRNSSKQTNAFTAHGSGGNEHSEEEGGGGKRKKADKEAQSTRSSNSNLLRSSPAGISAECLKPIVKVIIRALGYLIQAKCEFYTEPVVGYWNDAL